MKSDWEVDLAELLNDLSSVQDELLGVLSDKRDRMAAGDLQSMSEMAAREEQLCERLKACHDRRGQLLQRAGEQGLPHDSIGELASALPKNSAGKLGKRVKEASSRMRLLQHQSLTNWVLAQRTLLHLSQMLEIIATGGQLQPTYGRGESGHSRGALVDREA